MWKNTGGSASMCSLNSCERIRPERARNPIQRLVWGPGTQFQISGYSGLSQEELSCNPRVALRRLLRLYEGRQYREAASFLQKLPCYTFKAALPDIPIDLIVESLPHSLSLLEAVYARLLDLARTNDARIERSMLVRIEEQVIWRIVHHISMTENLRDASIWTKLLTTLSRLSPGSKKLLVSRRRSLERAVEGLGKHGLVPTNNHFDENLRPRFATIANRGRGRIFGNSSLRDAGTTGQNVSGSTSVVSAVEPPTALVPLTAKLRDELETRLEAYKLALHKIESLGKHNGGGIGVGGVGVVSVGGTRSRAGDRQVRAASHQRQLSLKYSEVQQRLIDNQSLLNILEKPSDRNLEDLIGELRRRIERDKEALRQWNAVKKSSGLNNGSGTIANNKNSALAASLLQFSRACSLALRLMNDSTDAGYEEQCHRTKELENFREDGFEAAESSSSAGYHTDDSCSPTPEPVVVTVNNTQGEPLEHAGASSRWTIEQLTDRYVALYAHAHLHTLDALDALESLKDATDLKAKILFSVVVLSWRVAEIVQTSRRHEAWKTLSGCPPDATSRSSPIIIPPINSDIDDNSTIRNPNIANNLPIHDGTPKLSNELNECMIRQLARFGCETGTRQVAESVLNQLERTLYDFPRLKECVELKRYALLSSSLAWICLARTNPLILDVAHGFAEFDSEIHARHHASSDPHGKRIVAVLWPGLLLRENSRTSCLYRAVVLT